MGCFQDGGLKENFAGGIAIRVAKEAWPRSWRPAQLLSLGTGTTARDAKKARYNPRYHHIVKSGSLTRVARAFKSSLSTEVRWNEMLGQLDKRIAENCRRFNVPLPDIGVTIDNIDAMDRYRNLVIFRPGSSKSAKFAAVELLVARLFFVLDAIPDKNSTPIWCHGSIRCKGSGEELLPALERLLPNDTLDFSIGTQPLGYVLSRENICPSCKRYRQSVSFPVSHLGEVVDLYLRYGRRQRWRINGFPSSVASFIDKQGLWSPFGRPDHGSGTAKPCDTCDAGRRFRGNAGQSFRGLRRKRSDREPPEAREAKRVLRGC